MKLQDFLRTMVSVAGCLAFIISLSVTTEKAQGKQHSYIKKSRAEAIALEKVHGGTVRSAELETSQGHHFWSVYVAKPGSKNAKEIRVDAITGQILTVQTEKPADQAEEPLQSH